MAYAMTKQGSLDNCITYEFICDTVADMNAIENAYRTIGTVAVVLTGESDGLEVYIAGSDKQWNSLSTTTSGSNSGDTTGLSIYICSQNEVNQGLPNISEPDETTIYLVASGQTSGNLYEEYIYVNNNWEKFGAASIDLSNYATKSEIAGFYTKPAGGIPDADLAHTYLTSHQDISGLAPKADPVFTGSISLGRKVNSSIGTNSVATGIDTVAAGHYSHAEGRSTLANEGCAHAEGQGTLAIGAASHAEGYGGTYTLNSTVHTAQAAGYADHTEGYSCLTTAGNAPGNHAEGFRTMATGGASHSEGASTIASSYTAHAEGYVTEARGQASHAEGTSTQAIGQNSHSEGEGGNFTINNVSYTSSANGYADHTEGYRCYTASAQPGNHAEGYQTRATGGAAHSEGAYTHAKGIDSHAEGYYTEANGEHSHAEGSYTYANGKFSHTEGYDTIANGLGSHAGGVSNVADNFDSWPEWTTNTSYVAGDKVKVTTTTNNVTTVHGYKCKVANNDASFTTSHWYEYDYMNYAEIIGNGFNTFNKSNAYALDWDGTGHFAGDVYVGCNTDSTGGTKVATLTDLNLYAPIADPTFTGTMTVTKIKSIAGGSATGNNSIALGGGTRASGNDAISVGGGTTASGADSFAQGGGSRATGVQSHAEGGSTQANGQASHSEGALTQANGMGSHAEGLSTIANASSSHAEGTGTIAEGTNTHVAGLYNIADSLNSWVEWEANTSYNVGDKVKITTIEDSVTTIQGYKCKTANNDAEFTSNNWQLDNNMNYAEIIGNGTSNARSNAYALEWNGTGHFAGDVYVGCNEDSTGGSKVATEAFVTARVPTPPVADGTYNLQVSVSSGTATYSWVAAPGSASGVNF